MATYRVTFVTDGQQTTVEASADQYLLDAGRAAGLDLPSMCLQGWCTTCAGRVLEGQVDQSEAFRIYPGDEAAGFVLLCSAYPRSDLRILTHQKEAMRAHTAERSVCLRPVGNAMNPLDDNLRHFLRGPLLETSGWPLTLRVFPCDLGRSFLLKGRAGRGYRAIARNGRVLLASDRPANELVGKLVVMRLQTWHRAILPGDPPQPYGLLLCVRTEATTSRDAPYETRLVRVPEGACDLAVEVGGQLWLAFRRRGNAEGE